MFFNVFHAFVIIVPCESPLDEFELDFYKLLWLKSTNSQDCHVGASGSRSSIHLFGKSSYLGCALRISFLCHF